MTEIKRTSSDDPNFVSLVALLDADLAIRDGADHGFYSQFNKIDKIKHCVVGFDNHQPLVCGAIRAVDDESTEIKRMYVHPSARNKGFATLILKELEKWAGELGYKRCVLETGKKQPEAIALYEKNGYLLIPNYGQYVGVENSLCFAKNV
jgi:putative acetyltransferase